jgi:prolipoprotein diacylglyceryltransferase
MEFTLLAAALTGALGAWLGLRIPAVRARAADIDKPWDVLVGAAAIGVFSGRLFELITSGVNPITNPFDIVLVRGGVDTTAASLAALATLAWVFRSDLVTLDALAPAALLGLAGWHAGCLWTGACLGTATGGEWGLTLPGSDVARHPTELYAAAALVLLAFIVARLETPFVASGVALAGAGAVRAITQPLRPSLTGGPLWAYLTAIVVGAGVAAFGRRAVAPSPTITPVPD